MSFSKKVGPFRSTPIQIRVNRQLFLYEGFPRFFFIGTDVRMSRKRHFIFSDLMEADANVVLHLQVECRGAPATASATAPAQPVPAPTGLKHRIRMV